jgi:type IV pilus assembly protein PilO
MKDILRNPLFVLIFSTIIFVLLFAYMQFSVLGPMAAEKEKLEKKQKLEQTMLLNAKQKVSDTEHDTIVQIKSLHEQVPAKAYVGQFLFSIEKAKVISDSDIMELSVTENVTEQELNKVTVNLSVVSPNYFAMQSFLNTLEGNKRITTIDELSFSEEIIEDNTDEESTFVKVTNPGEVYYDVTLSTYYFPKYKDVVDALPMQEIYNVGQKTNPLAGTEVNPEDVKLHAALNHYIVAINEADAAKLEKVIVENGTTENGGQQVSTNANELMENKLHVELMAVTIDKIQNSQATVHYVQKVTKTDEQSDYKDRIIEGTYVLKKINGNWKIANLFVINEVYLTTE